MITIPNQNVTTKLLQLRSLTNLPIAKIDFDFKAINMNKGIDFIKRLVDSGRLFEYESYIYQTEDSQFRSNLNTRSYVYDIKPSGEVAYKRYSSLTLTPAKILTCTVWNKNIGYFPEFVEAYPELVELSDRFLLENSIKMKNCTQISLVYVDDYLPYHIDFDSLFAVRLNLNHSKYLFSLKKIPDGQQSQICHKFLFPPKDFSYDKLLDLIADFPVEYKMDSASTGNAFIIDSFNYLHDFVPYSPSWLMSFNLSEF